MKISWPPGKVYQSVLPDVLLNDYKKEIFLIEE